MAGEIVGTSEQSKGKICGEERMMQVGWRFVGALLSVYIAKRS